MELQRRFAFKSLYDQHQITNFVNAILWKFPSEIHVLNIYVKVNEKIDANMRNALSYVLILQTIYVQINISRITYNLVR